MGDKSRCEKLADKILGPFKGSRKGKNEIFETISVLNGKSSLVIPYLPSRYSYSRKLKDSNKTPLASQ